MNISLPVFVSIISALVSIAALYNFIVARRAATMAAGAKDERFKHMQEELEHAYERIKTLEAARHGAELEVRDMKKDIEYIKLSVDEIKVLLRQREC